MQKEADKEYISPEGYKLRYYNEETEKVTLKIPVETMRVMRKVAEHRSLPVEAVLRLYIGQGLRADLSENFRELARELFERRFRNRKKGNSKSEDIDLAA